MLRTREYHGLRALPLRPRKRLPGNLGPWRMRTGALRADGVLGLPASRVQPRNPATELICGCHTGGKPSEPVRKIATKRVEATGDVKLTGQSHQIQHGRWRVVMI